jgi:hypothetical protein
LRGHATRPETVQPPPAATLPEPPQAPTPNVELDLYAAPPPAQWGESPVWALPDVVGAAPAARPAPTAIARRRVDPQVASKLLASGMRERDREIGFELPAANTVASVIAANVRRNTPSAAFATFTAHIGSDGRVSDVRIAAFSKGTVDQWNAAAAAAKTALGKRTFNMHGPFASGAQVTVKVTKCVQKPSGAGCKRRQTKPPPEKPRWPFAPPATNERLIGNAKQLDPIDYPLETDIAMPRLRLGPGVSGGSMLSGTFDVSDIGATEQLVVGVTIEVTPITALQGARL